MARKLKVFFGYVCPWGGGEYHAMVIAHSVAETYEYLCLSQVRYESKNGIRERWSSVPEHEDTAGLAPGPYYRKSHSNDPWLPIPRSEHER